MLEFCLVVHSLQHSGERRNTVLCPSIGVRPEAVLWWLILEKSRTLSTTNRRGTTLSIQASFVVLVSLTRETNEQEYSFEGKTARDYKRQAVIPIPCCCCYYYYFLLLSATEATFVSWLVPLDMHPNRSS